MRKQTDEMMRLNVLALAALAVALGLAVGGCDNAGVNKLLGLDVGDVVNSGTIVVQNVHVEGQDNWGSLDQSERMEAVR